jgi:DNA-binding protein H-NS
MAKTYTQVQRQIAKLQREADALKKKEVGGVVARIKEAIQHYELTAADLFDGRGSKGTSSSKQKVSSSTSGLKGKKVPIKYRDENGNTWTSRGSQPKWLAASLASGRKIEEFLVKPH